MPLVVFNLYSIVHNTRGALVFVCLFVSLFLEREKLGTIEILLPLERMVKILCQVPTHMHTTHNWMSKCGPPKTGTHHTTWWVFSYVLKVNIQMVVAKKLQFHREAVMEISDSLEEMGLHNHDLLELYTRNYIYLFEPFQIQPVWSQKFYLGMSRLIYWLIYKEIPNFAFCSLFWNKKNNQERNWSSWINNQNFETLGIFLRKIKHTLKICKW